MHSLLALFPGHLDLLSLLSGEVVVVLDVLTSKILVVQHRCAIAFVFVPSLSAGAVPFLHGGLQVLFSSSSEQYFSICDFSSVLEVHFVDQGP